MIWRESLPARVALATTGLLALVMLLTTGAAYVMTAFTIRNGVDSTLAATVPVSEADLHEAEERSGKDWERERRSIQSLDLRGNARLGEPRIQADPQAVAEAVRSGVAFVSLVKRGGEFQPRSGPDWWQALTPQDNEYRVIYARRGETVIQVATPLDPVAKALPRLLRWMGLLAVIGVALSGLVAWRMAGQTYRPLRAITATADQITTETLSVRISDVWHDRTLRRLTGVLNAMIARLQESFEAQGRFVSAAAHELRTPLGAMRAELEVALRRERTPAEYREALAGALEETERLTALAERLLILARYEHGAAWSMEHDLSVRDLLVRVTDQVRRSVGGAVSVEASYDLLLDGDPVALEQVVGNLVRNGLEAGGAPVRVVAEPVGNEVVIRVQDQGQGIPSAALPNLFDPFFRADPSRKRDGGTGLGLAIVKNVVDAHGGNVTVESELGKGTTFTVRLPRRRG